MTKTTQLNCNEFLELLNDKRWESSQMVTHDEYEDAYASYECNYEEEFLKEFAEIEIIHTLDHEIYGKISIIYHTSCEWDKGTNENFICSEDGIENFIDTWFFQGFSVTDSDDDKQWLKFKDYGCPMHRLLESNDDEHHILVENFKDVDWSKVNKFR